MSFQIITKQRSVIERYPKTGVGKYIGGRLYFRVLPQYVERVMQEFPRFRFAWEELKQANAIAAFKNELPVDIEFRCACYDTYAGRLRLDEGPDFDTAREPHVGVWTRLQDGKLVIGRSQAIWHHKFLWVDDFYTECDMEEAKRWSETYLPLIAGTPKGTDQAWQAQLKRAGLK